LNYILDIIISKADLAEPSWSSSKAHSSIFMLYVSFDGAPWGFRGLFVWSHLWFSTLRSLV